MSAAPSPSLSPPASSADSATVRPAAGVITWRRLAKWFMWSICILTVLVALFLTLPGFECSWRFPKNSGRTWIELRREKGHVLETRAVSLGPFRAGVVFINRSFSSFTPHGSHWRDDVFYYTGDNWQFHLRPW